MSLTALRLLVAGLGVCVVLAFAVLVAVILTRKPAVEPAASRPSAAPPLESDAVTAWGRIALDQPVGTRVQSLTASGAFIVLHLYTASPGQDERLVVFDPATGRIVGTVAVGSR